MKWKDSFTVYLVIGAILCLIGFALYSTGERNKEEEAQACRRVQDSKGDHWYCDSVDMQERMARQRKELREIQKKYE